MTNRTIRGIALLLLLIPCSLAAVPAMGQQPATPAKKTRKAKVIGRKKVERKYKDGTVRERYELQKYSNGRSIKDGMYTSWFPNGQVNRKGMYVLSKKSGEWVFYFDSGKVAKKGVYVQSMPDGKWIVNNEDGSPLRLEFYKSGKAEGKWILYAQGKVFREIDYKDGKRNGLVREFYPENDALRFTMEMKDDKKHGQIVSYYPDGEKLSEENFTEGKRNGRVVSWSKAGKVIHYVEFVDGSQLDGRLQSAGAKGAEKIPTPPSDDESSAEPDSP